MVRSWSRLLTEDIQSPSSACRGPGKPAALTQHRARTRMTEVFSLEDTFKIVIENLRFKSSKSILKVLGSKNGIYWWPGLWGNHFTKPMQTEQALDGLFPNTHQIHALLCPEIINMFINFWGSCWSMQSLFHMHIPSLWQLLGIQEESPWLPPPPLFFITLFASWPRGSRMLREVQLVKVLVVYKSLCSLLSWRKLLTSQCITFPSMISHLYLRPTKLVSLSSCILMP